MEVHLKPNQEAFIQHRVSVGDYATADEAVQAAVDLLERTETVTVNLLDASAPKDSKATGAKLVAAMQASPCKEIELEPSRPHMPVRDVSF